MGNHLQCKACHKCNDNDKEESFHEDDDRINNIINNDQFEYKYNIDAIIGREKSDNEDCNDNTIEYSINEDEKIVNDYIISSLNKNKSNNYSGSNSNSTANTNNNNVNGNLVSTNSNISFNVNSPCISPHLETINEINNENTITLLSKNNNDNNTNKVNVLSPPLMSSSSGSNNEILKRLQLKSIQAKESKKLKSNRLINHHTKAKPPPLLITSIIPSYKLESSSQTDVFYQGELLKYSKNADYKYAHMLTYRYLIISKSELRIYRSKEIFLRMKSPLLTISIKNIIKVERTEIIELMNNKKKDYYSFYIEYFSAINGNTNFINVCPSFESSLSKIENESNQRNISKSIESFFKEYNDYNYSIKLKKRRGQKMNLIITSSDKNSLDDDTLFKSSIESVLLASEKEEDVDKWIVVINYLIGKPM